MRQIKSEETSRYQVFSRRAAVLGGAQAILLTALGVRLYYLQVEEGDRYGLLAEENRINLRLLQPPRGEIVDRFGRPLAVNRNNYRVLMVPEDVREKTDVATNLDTLSRIIDLSERRRQKIMREVRRKRGFVPIVIKDFLTWEQVAQIEVNALELPGMNIDAGLTRYYPFADATAHLVGYVAAASERDQENSEDPLLELPGFRVGKSGVERTYDLALRGSAGTMNVEVDAAGRVRRELARQPGKPGRKLVLTVDMDLQRNALTRLSHHRSAAAVVMDAYTGDLLTLASSPTFDPNIFNRGISKTEWQDLVSNPLAPLINKATVGQYHPGSVFKMIVALAALEEGMDPLERINCHGWTEEGPDRFHCWKRGGHGPMNMVQSIAQSCDVYYYELGRRVGMDKIAAMAKRFGMGEETGIDLTHEEEGLVPTHAWKRAELGQPWHRGETLVASIGQGYLLATPLQMAVMTARLINGGQAVRPHLKQGLVDQDSSVERAKRHEWGSIGIDPAHLNLMMTAMDQAVNKPRGTAFGSRIRLPGMRMGGKTGTSQVRRITLEERENRVLRNDELPWEERDHALFVGYGPTPNPRYVVAVVVEHGGGGARVAAPLARDLMVETMRRDPSRRRGTLNLADASTG